MFMWFFHNIFVERCLKMCEEKWLDIYQNVKEKLNCKIDLESYFTQKKIGKIDIDTINIGEVHLPTGEIVACDPFVELEERLPFIQKVPVGTYPVKICVVPSEKYGDRYACVKVSINDNKPSRYELGITGKENPGINNRFDCRDYFGFGVNTGMGCVTDLQTKNITRNITRTCVAKNVKMIFTLICMKTF